MMQDADLRDRHDGGAVASRRDRTRKWHWIQGRTAEVMFINSYLSRVYGVFRAWQRASPGTLRMLSILIGLAQTLFQMAMIPLVFTRWGRVFVRALGWTFILVSVLDLQLTLLPFVEVVLWAMVFLPSRWFAAPGRLASEWAHGSHQVGDVGFVAMEYTAGYGALSLLFFTNAILGSTSGGSLAPWIANPVLYYAGLVAPIVFNTIDLTTGDRWAALTRIDEAQAPWFRSTGSRENVCPTCEVTCCTSATASVGGGR